MHAKLCYYLYVTAASTTGTHVVHIAAFHQCDLHAWLDGMRDAVVSAVGRQHQRF